MDMFGRTINVGDYVVCSAGKNVEVYEVLKVKRNNRGYTKIYVNVGSSKKWKSSIDCLLYEPDFTNFETINNRLVKRI